MSFSLIILGSSSAVPTSKRFPPAHLLNVDERFYLIDCGEGTQMQLRRFGIRFGRIRHIFISHLHGDHIFGLFGLISSFSLMGRTDDLHIYAHPELEKILQFHLQYFGQDRDFQLIFHPVTGKRSKRIFEDEKVTVDTIPLKHSTVCHGFLFREKEKLRNISKEAIAKYHIPIRQMMAIKQGQDFIADSGDVIPNEEITTPPPPQRTYAYCSDTGVFPGLPKIVKGVDILYHEATFLGKDEELARETMHSTAGQAAMTAREAAVRHLIIGHFSTRYKNTDAFLQEASALFPNVYEACDGFRYRLNHDRSLIIEACEIK